MKTESKILSLRLPAELATKLTKRAHLLAIERGEYISVNALITQLLKRSLQEARS